MGAVAKPLVLVAAVADNGVIGHDNCLIWRLRSDLRRFRAITIGKPLIMGRKTFDSIGRPLPDRQTIVMTRQPDWVYPGVLTARSFDAARALADEEAHRMGAAEVIVAGGAQVYEQALPHADGLRMTFVHTSPQGDARFPDFDRAAFTEVARSEHPAGPDDEFSFAFVDFERSGAS